MIVSEATKKFVENYISNTLDSRKKDLRAQLDVEKDGHMRVVITNKLIEVIEISISLRDAIHPTRITNNDHEDDGN